MQTIEDFQNEIAKAKSGDEQALDYLLRRFEGHLMQFASRLLGPRGLKHIDASDVVQDVFAGVCRSIQTFQGNDEATFTAWLNRICRNKVAEFLRSQIPKIRRAKLEQERPTGESHLDFVALQTSVCSRVVKRQYENYLAETINWLPDDDRLIVEQRFLQGNSIPWDELATRLKVKPEALRKRLSRLLLLLRKGIELMETMESRQMPEELISLMLARYIGRLTPEQISEEFEISLDLVDASLETIEKLLAGSSDD